MTEIITSNSSTMLETQFFMMKYGVFIVAGIIGSIASVTNGDKYTIQTFTKRLTLTIIFSIVFGILLVNFWGFSLEVCFAIVVVLSFFVKKVIGELNEILEGCSDLVTSFIKTKFKIKEDKVEEENENI